MPEQLTEIPTWIFPSSMLPVLLQNVGGLSTYRSAQWPLNNEEKEDIPDLIEESSTQYFDASVKRLLLHIFMCFFSTKSSDDFYCVRKPVEITISFNYFNNL